MTRGLPLLPGWVRWTAVTIVAAGILGASVIDPPSAGKPPLGPFGLVRTDKWLHFLAYAGLGATVAYALAGLFDRSIVVLLAFLVAAGYGLGIEIGQTGVVTRSFDPSDALANAFGAGVAALGWGLLRLRIALVPVDPFDRSADGVIEPD